MTSFCENLQKHSDGSFLPINAEISQVNCTCLCRSALNRKKPPGFCAVMFGRQTLSKEVMRKRRVWIGRSVVKALKPPSEPHRIFSWPGRSRVCIVTLQSPATKDDEKLVAAGFGAVKLESCSLIFSVFWDLTFPSKSQLHGTRQKNVCTCQKRRVVYEQQGLYEAVLHHCQSLQGPGVMSFWCTFAAVIRDSLQLFEGCTRFVNEFLVSRAQFMKNQTETSSTASNIMMNRYCKHSACVCHTCCVAILAKHTQIINKILFIISQEFVRWYSPTLFCKPTKTKNPRWISHSLRQPSCWQLSVLWNTQSGRR